MSVGQRLQIRPGKPVNVLFFGFALFYPINIFIFNLKKNLTRGARELVSIALFVLVIGAIATKTNSTFEKTLIKRNCKRTQLPCNEKEE